MSSKFKFTDFAKLGRKLEYARYRGIRIGNHPLMTERAPLVPLDALPPELPGPERPPARVDGPLQPSPLQVVQAS